MDVPVHGLEGEGAHDESKHAHRLDTLEGEGGRGVGERGGEKEWGRGVRERERERGGGER